MRTAWFLGLLLVVFAAVAHAQRDRPPPSDQPPPPDGAGPPPDRPPPPDGAGPPRGGGPLTTRTIPSSGSVEILAEVWADNWFAFYLGETPIAEDSVPITTERSFNAERFVFRADFPLTLNVVAKDYRQDDTGLEYIGTRRQQMGDGGLIAQFTDLGTGRVIAVTDDTWKCLVTHEAPLDRACERAADPRPGLGDCQFSVTEEPAGWRRPDFDDSSWDGAREYGADVVRPKDGYDRIDWSPSASLIWGPDLETDNTLLCRTTINR